MYIIVLYIFPYKKKFIFSQKFNEPSQQFKSENNDL